MNEVNIRQATMDDLEGCYVVELRCFVPSQAATKEKIKKRLELFAAGFFVAQLDGQVIGMLNSGATYKDDITDEALKAMVGHDPDGPNIIIFSVAVLPEFQRRGVAAKLLNRFIERARSLNKEKAFLICKPHLVRYYQKFGFIDVGPSASTFAGFKWHEMYLPLLL
ncbi:MAG: GNAT family N-acetyltransferase [Ardenticatenaceae bacterium]